MCCLVSLVEGPLHISLSLASRFPGEISSLVICLDVFFGILNSLHGAQYFAGLIYEKERVEFAERNDSESIIKHLIMSSHSCCTKEWLCSSNYDFRQGQVWGAQPPPQMT